jgi:two-component system sensor kinase FixL
MDGAPRRELVVSARTIADNMRQISVADTGSGLAPEQVDQLFKPFHSTKAQGMGVGLSISRTIVEAHGGRIWAEANPGGGTIFHFTMHGVLADELTDHD